MLSLDFGFVCLFIGFAHLTESRVLVLGEYGDDPVTLDHIEKSSQEEVQKQPIFPEPKRTRNSKKTVVQFGRHIYHLDNYKDTREIISKIKPESNSYDYVDVDKLIRSQDSAKDGVRDYLKDFFILSDSPLNLCNGRQCKDDLRKSSKKHKKHHDDDDIDWKQNKKMPLPLGHMKRFQIVDNKHNSVRDSKFGSGEHKGKKKAKKHKKYSSGSDESKESGSEEKNSGRSHKKKKRKLENSDESDIIHEDSASASFEKWKNHEENSKSDEDIPKKKTKKKKKKHTEEPEDTKRKTIPVEDTYFMQGNKIYHSNGKSKKKHDNIDTRRQRLEHFMPKRYHWDSSEIHHLGYYWFNGPKGLYPEPKPLSI